jgi:PIN domain nuclease of toxin-antitoxin system
MKALLDTHTFLWWITDDPQLSSTARKIIGDGENELFLSAASGWEIAIKARLGKLQVPDNLELFMADQLAANDINVLPVQMSHVRKFLSGS